MNTIAYKVVTSDYKSTAATGKYELSYEIGSIVEAESCTLGIMLFDTLRHAKMFMLCLHCYKILEAVTLAPVYKENTIFVCPFFDTSAISMFYKHTLELEPAIAPIGTICCHKIRVLREIQHDSL